LNKEEIYKTVINRKVYIEKNDTFIVF